MRLYLTNSKGLEIGLTCLALFLHFLFLLIHFLNMMLYSCTVKRSSRTE